MLWGHVLLNRKPSRVLNILIWYIPNLARFMTYFPMLHDLELLKLHWHLLSMVLLVPSPSILKNLPRLLQRRNTLLLLKLLLNLHPILGKPQKLMSSSPAQQRRLRSVRRRGKLKISLTHLRLLPMMVLNVNLSIVVLSVMRITSLKTVLDGMSKSFS